MRGGRGGGRGGEGAGQDGTAPGPAGSSQRTEDLLHPNACKPTCPHRPHKSQSPEHDEVCIQAVQAVPHVGRVVRPPLLRKGERAGAAGAKQQGQVHTKRPCAVCESGCMVRAVKHWPIPSSPAAAAGVILSTTVTQQQRQQRQQGFISQRPPPAPQQRCTKVPPASGCTP